MAPRSPVSALVQPLRHHHQDGRGVGGWLALQELRNSAVLSLEQSSMSSIPVGTGSRRSTWCFLASRSVCHLKTEDLPAKQLKKKSLKRWPSSYSEALRMCRLYLCLRYCASSSASENQPKCRANGIQHVFFNMLMVTTLRFQSYL